MKKNTARFPWLLVLALVVMVAKWGLPPYGAGLTATTPTTRSSESVASAVGPNQAVIPDWAWVNVMNKMSVTQQFSNGSHELVAGDTCGVESGGVITLVEDRGENLLVEYSAPGNPAGTPCPSGVQFLVNKSEFAKMTAQYTANRNSIQSEKELVTKILAQNYHGEVTDAGEWYWVDVVNIDPVSNMNGGFAYGDTCGVGHSDYGDGYVVEGGTVQTRGKAKGKTLYEYTARGKHDGTPCPSGVLFFM